MVYEIVMPQLSDSMEEGKLIAWKKKVGDRVAVGDVIAEVESDKAIMEIQTFKAGTLSELLLQEGESAPVGSVIAKIDTSNQSTATPPKKEPLATKQPPERLKMQKESPSRQEKPKRLIPPHTHTPLLSPKAKATAAKYGLKYSTLHRLARGVLLHEKDIEQLVINRYFTKKAQKLLQTYALDPHRFTLDHKIDAYEVKTFIHNQNIPKSRPLKSFEKALIAHVSASAAKPTYRVYEALDASRFLAHQNHSITAWLVKLLASAMMRHPKFRSVLSEEKLLTYDTASIAVAVADEEALYMPVVKNAHSLTIQEITHTLKRFKTKLQEKSFTQEDLSGSTFSVSNLGMFGIKRFDAMINKNDCGIAAVGAVDATKKLPITLTLDHRLINGRDAALFVQTLKELASEEKNFKE